MNQNKIIAVLLVLLALLGGGCAKEREETPIKGHVRVLTDEAVAPLVQVEKDTFEGLYKDAKVSLETMNAREALVSFFNNDSFKVVVVSRPLNKEERAVMERDNLKFAEYKIAIDAVVFITHKENPVTELRTTQLDSIFRGITTSWKPLGWGDAPGGIALCLPDQNSASFEVVGTKILKGEKFGSAEKIVAASQDMVEYVASTKRALGMVNITWLQGNEERLTVLGINDPAAPDSLSEPGKYYKPFQAYIYQGVYPLTKDVYIYSRADLYNVGAGFISFITSAPGQKIVLKTGLVPGTMPVRMVQLTNKDL